MFLLGPKMSTRKSPGPVCGWVGRILRPIDRIDLSCPLQERLQLICWRDRQEVRSEDQGSQERSRLFHSWYTDPSLQGKGKQCNSQVSHNRPCRGRCLTAVCLFFIKVLQNHVIDWQKAKVVDREAQRQTRWIKRGTLDQEDTDVHESGCKILPTQPHMGQGDFQVTCSIEL